MLIALLLALCQDNWDDRLPADTLAVLRVENGKDFTAAFKKTGFGMLLADAEIAAFVASIRSDNGDFERYLADVALFFKKLDVAFGGNFENGFGSIRQFQLAVLPGQQMPTVIVSADLKDKPELEASLRRALKEEMFRGQVPEMQKVEGVEVEGYGRDAFVARVGSSLVLSNTLDGILVSARKQENPLSKNPRYVHARKALEINSKSAFLYIDLPSVLKMVQGMLPPDAGQYITMLGLDKAQYIAASVEGDGDAWLARAHLNLDLTAAAPVAPKDLLDRSMADLSKLPGVISVQSSWIRGGELFKEAMARLRPNFKMLQDLLQGQSGVKVDLSKLPVEAIAKHLGEARDVTVISEKGFTLVSRSNSGATLSPFGVSQVAIVAAIAIPGLLSANRASGERNASGTLKTMGTIQAMMRSNDMDNNQINDYWVGDVSGVYRIKSGDSPIKLCDLAMAMADAKPLPGGKEAGGADLGEPLTPRPVPKTGYLFQAIPRYGAGEGKSEPYNNGKNRNNDRYGYCAFPANYPSTGRLTFILSEGGTVYKKDTGGKAVEEFPFDPASEGWSKLD